MIASVRGRLLGEPDADGIVVEVGGIGLRVHVTAAAERAANGSRERVFLHTYLAVREDALTLYGFADTGERELFLLLQSVSGLGPKTALALLSAYPEARVRIGIASGDVALLTSVSGIGKRIAERVVVELKDKLGALPIAPARRGVEGPAGDRLEARDALVALGYAVGDAEAALEGGEGDAEERIRGALARLRR